MYLLNRQCAALPLLLFAIAEQLFAFAPVAQTQRAEVSPSLLCGLRTQTAVSTRVWMADENEAEDAANDVENVTEGALAEEAKEQEPEDPEIVALKEEISELESTLKNRRNTLAYAQDQVDEYSKTGYARKVAEMENMRRARSSMNSSSRSSANAAVLADFLPVYDEMNQLKEKYADDAFGSKYGGLSMEAALTKLGVKEYTAQVGETADGYRLAVVDSEYSDAHAKDAVIRPIAVGLELEGNVLRAAQCVASLGSEGEAQEETEEGEDSVPDETEETNP